MITQERNETTTSELEERYPLINEKIAQLEDLYRGGIVSILEPKIIQTKDGEKEGGLSIRLDLTKYLENVEHNTRKSMVKVSGDYGIETSNYQLVECLGDVRIHPDISTKTFYTKTMHPILVVEGTFDDNNTIDSITDRILAESTDSSAAMIMRNLQVPAESAEIKDQMDYIQSALGDVDIQKVDAKRGEGFFVDPDMVAFYDKQNPREDILRVSTDHENTLDNYRYRALLSQKGSRLFPVYGEKNGKTTAKLIIAMKNGALGVK